MSSEVSNLDLVSLPIVFGKLIQASQLSKSSDIFSAMSAKP
jgi:hypothetical protein